jgi:hypothetical protein
MLDVPAYSASGAIWNILHFQSFIKLTTFLSLSSKTACLLISGPSIETFVILFAFVLSVCFHQSASRRCSLKKPVKIHNANVTGTSDRSLVSLIPNLSSR